MRRLCALASAATAAVAIVTLTPSLSPAFGSARALSAVSGVMAPKVVSWPSVEPADDYTANSLLAFALGADQDSGLG
jgi:hypothetical protein